MRAPRDVAAADAFYQVQLSAQQRVDQYLRTGDRERFLGYRWPELPWPETESLALWLDDPALRDVLPPPLRPSERLVWTVLSGDAWGAGGTYPTTPQVPAVWGSYSDSGDAGVGVSASAPFRPGRRNQVLTYAGYPGRMDGALRLRDGSRQTLVLIPDAGETWLQIRLPTAEGHDVSLEVHDTSDRTWWAIADVKSMSDGEVLTDWILSHSRLGLVVAGLLWCAVLLTLRKE
jgi:hypothetical protein